LSAKNSIDATSLKAVVLKNIQALRLVKKYPIPIFALFSLISGAILHWGLDLTNEAHWLWFVTLLIGGAPVIWETARGITRKQFASDIVATMAIIAAIVLNDAFPGVVIVLMQTGGKALEDYAFRRASSSLNALLTRSPRVAHRRVGELIEEVDVKNVRIDDLLIVRPGDLVPVDGIIVSGTSQLDESSLTGESLPKSKGVGEKVFSGTVNVATVFEMRAEKLSGESQYAKIVELVRKAQQEKAPIHRLADKYAVWFTPIAVSISIFGWLITGDPRTILAVLVVATPCSLIFATPVAIIGGINRAARKGIIVKHGAPIELIGKAQVAVFDKTGTITYGTPEVKQILTFDRIDGHVLSPSELLYKAASVEQMSSHPTAQALMRVGKERIQELGIPLNFREIAGSGVEGDLNGEHIVVGSDSLFPNISKEEKHRMIELIEEKTGSSRSNVMLAYVGINGQPAGAIVLGDKIRSGVDKMMKDLNLLGVKRTIMLTGDSRENAHGIARLANVSSFESNLLPQQKVASVKRLKQVYGNIVMVGDGINDAPALASATVGVAMGARGSAISTEAADIVLMEDDVTKVTDAIKISQNTIKIAKQSIFVGLGVSLLLMVIASFGLIPPTIGALLQECLDVAVILNAIRARRQ
jgi:heavy metal translocating P-type ATPase